MPQLCAHLPDYPAMTNIETKRCDSRTQAWGTQPGRLTPEGLIERHIYEVQYDTPAAGEQRGIIEDGIIEGHILRVAAVPIPEPSVEELEAQRQSAVEQLQEATTRYMERQLDAYGIRLVDRLAASTDPTAQQMAAETTAWAEGVYAESYRRQALVAAGLWPNVPETDPPDPADFTGWVKPYSVPQMMAALG